MGFCRHRENKNKKSFSDQAICVITLTSVVPNIAKKAGRGFAKLLNGYSLRASAVTAFYDYGFDYNSVRKQFSGHRSDLTVCEY